MEENLAKAAEKLAAQLTGRWSEEMRRGIAEELQPVLAAELRNAGDDATLAFASNLTRLLQAPNQMEILNVLLDVTQDMAPHAGLLVLRGGSFVGWQSRGIRDAAAFTRLSIPAGEPMMTRLAQTRQPFPVQPGELGAAFATAAGEIHLLPLLIRDRLAGVFCADTAGISSRVEALQAFTLAACLAVEATSQRKPVGAVVSQPLPPDAPAQRVAPVSEGVRAEQPLPAAPGAERAAAYTPPAARAQAASARAVPPPGTVVPMPVSADSEEHVKAKRFAKLLVEEIQLYNQAKVAEGRARRDLYDRLRSDIEKSRAAYQKRYGGVIRDADYFTDALIRILAANDRALLGSGFPG